MGHKDNVLCADFSPNGKYALSGNEDRTLILWDTRTGKEIRTFTGHSNPVTSVTFSPDGEFAISGSSDKTLKLWDINTGIEIRTFTENFYINSVSYSPDGKFVLSGGKAVYENDKNLTLWDIRTGIKIRNFKGHSKTSNGYLSEVTSVSISPDGKYALSGSLDCTIILWDINSGEEIKTFKGHNDGVNSVCFSPYGKYALSGSQDATLKLWDISSGQDIRSFIGNRFGITSVKYSPDGKFALSGCSDGRIKLWDINTEEEIRTFTGPTYKVTSISFSPDGKYALSGGLNKTLKLWNISTGREVRSFTGFYNPVSSVSFSPNEKFILSGCNNLKLWDISTGKVRTFIKSIGDVQNICFSPNGKFALSSSGWVSFKLWDVSTGNEIRAFNLNNEIVSCFCFSPDGKFILSGSQDGNLTIWNNNSGEKVRSFKKNNFEIQSVCFSPDGKYALSGNYDNEIILWDINTGKEIKTLSNDLGSCYSIDISSDGKYALSSSDGNYFIRLWDFNTGKVIKNFTDNIYQLSHSACFSPNGKFALSGHYFDFTLKLWEISSGNEIKNFKGHKDAVLSVSFSPDGKFALSGSIDGTIKIWDIEKGEEVVSLISYVENDFISITPDNYYTCPRGGLNGIAFVIDNQAFPPEQFDLQYNRPDIVLERIGYADSALIKAYRDAYYKRLRKMKFKEEWFKPDFYMPEINIENKDEFIDNEINEREIKLKIFAKDEKQNTLDRINVFVNGVPVFGTNGIDIRGENVFNIEKEIGVQLNDSVNKIEVSVLNHAGVESLKDNIEVTYIGNKAEPKTYFIGIGISDYKDESWRLNYAAKDIRDLAGLYENKAIIDTLIDEQATKENILKLKEKLLNTEVDDEVIIVLSGHGILNDSNDFYYATWDMDFTKPEKSGLLYDELDKLLDSIPARKKVLLIDACNSGEVDKDPIQDVKLNIENKEIAEINDGEKGIPIELKKVQEKSKVGLKNSFEIMQEIFVNLTRGNGAVVISAARGYQSALEKEYYGSGNGVFTACILELINSKKPGEQITVSELKEYVIKRVEEITNGAQVPTTRRENLAYDFIIW